MPRRIALILSLSGVFWTVGCVPQPAPMSARPPTAAPAVDTSEAPRAARAAAFNPLDTGGPASTGSSGY